MFLSDLFCVFVCFLWAFWEYFDLYLLVLFRSEKFIFIICWSISSSVLSLSLIICPSVFAKFNTSVQLTLRLSTFSLCSVAFEWCSLSYHLGLIIHPMNPFCTGVVSYAFHFHLYYFHLGLLKHNLPLFLVSVFFLRLKHFSISLVWSSYMMHFSVCGFTSLMIVFFSCQIVLSC